MTEHSILSDVEAIRRISVLYNRYADACDGERFASLFTEDGVFDIVGAGVFVGRSEIASVCRAANGIVHLVADSMVDVSGSTATQASKLILFTVTSDQSAMSFAATTSIQDDFVKLDGRWFIKRRRSCLDTKVALSRLGLVGSS
jgi:uncharacterized protein (TIGR02246 family)